MELVFYPGDRVLNLEPHYSEEKFLITLNEIGIVESVTSETVTVLWPYGVKTTVSLAGIMPYQSTTKR